MTLQGLRVWMLLSVCLPGLVSASGWVLRADDWARPRSAVVLVALQPLPQAVTALHKQAGSRLVIRYPGGEMGLLWAKELRAWLAALGVPPARLELTPGSSTPNDIEIELID
ncbi:MAG TPA: hypothetical protein ENJ79_11235 [Gammaproteobacteria bacterium]|nr:hypothetical protein [Gammaproteobacteria bacterium]